MLGDKPAAATVAVKNLAAARKFYEGTLGLRVADIEGDQVVAYRSGSSTVLVYQSQYAGTNKATAVTWTVGPDVEGVVAALKSKGAKFERYDMPGLTLEGDVHVGGGMKVAWLKDPDGNILSIVSG